MTEATSNAYRPVGTHRGSQRNSTGSLTQERPPQHQKALRDFTTMMAEIPREKRTHELSDEQKKRLADLLNQSPNEGVISSPWKKLVVYSYSPRTRSPLLLRAKPPISFDSCMKALPETPRDINNLQQLIDLLKAMVDVLTSTKANPQMYSNHGEQKNVKEFLESVIRDCEESIRYAERQAK